MVIVAAPDTLIMVLDVAVIMARLSRTIVNANTMQVVRHFLEGQVLRLKQGFLQFNLLLEGSNLLLHFRTVCV